MTPATNSSPARIPTEIHVAFNGEFIEVAVRGHFDSNTAIELWSRIQEACKLNKCTYVLGVADTLSQVDQLDVAQHGKLFDSLGITHKHRIAWVEQNSQAAKIAFNIETILLNRGFKARLFDNVEQARAWLLKHR